MPILKQSNKLLILIIWGFVILGWIWSIKKPPVSERLFICDPAGARTQDPMLKRHMLYLLSYGIISEFEGAKLLFFLINANTFLKFI